MWPKKEWIKGLARHRVGGGGVVEKTGRRKTEGCEIHEKANKEDDTKANGPREKNAKKKTGPEGGVKKGDCGPQGNRKSSPPGQPWIPF